MPGPPLTGPVLATPISSRLPGLNLILYLLPVSPSLLQQCPPLQLRPPAREGREGTPPKGTEETPVRVLPGSASETHATCWETQAHSLGKVAPGQWPPLTTRAP